MPTVKISECWCGYTIRDDNPELTPRIMRAHQFATHGYGREDKPHACFCSDCDCESIVTTDMCQWCSKGFHKPERKP